MKKITEKTLKLLDGREEILHDSFQITDHDFELKLSKPMGEEIASLFLYYLGKDGKIPCLVLSVQNTNFMGYFVKINDIHLRRGLESRNGIGSQILKYMLEKLITSNFSFIFGEVKPDTSIITLYGLIKFYEKNGFKIKYTSKSGYPITYKILTKSPELTINIQNFINDL